MVLPRHAWGRLYQQRLVILLTMLAMVWPRAVRRVHLSDQPRGAAAGSRTGVPPVHPGGRAVLLDLHVRPGGFCRVPRCAGRARPHRAGSREQRAAALLQPAAHAVELRPGQADGARRDAVGRHVGPGPHPVRAAGGPGRRLVVLVQLDAWRGHGRGVRVVAARAEPRGDGQFRVREVARGGGRGQPGVLLPPDRRGRDDQQRVPGELGARDRPGLGGEPGVVRAARRRAARGPRRDPVGAGARRDSWCCWRRSSNDGFGRWRSSHDRPRPRLSPKATARLADARTRSGRPPSSSRRCRSSTARCSA